MLLDENNRLKVIADVISMIYREMPSLMYIGLKLYSATRSRKIIDILYKHGLCVSYDRILRITQGLAEASIEMFENDVVPGNMRQGIFTVGAKDNVDKDSPCAVTKSHYHGTNLSLFQFPSAANNGIERKYEKFVKINSCGSKKVKDLPRFYVDVNEINDPPSTFFPEI